MVGFDVDEACARRRADRQLEGAKAREVDADEETVNRRVEVEGLDLQGVQSYLEVVEVGW